LLGNAVSDSRATTDAAVGRDFLDPNFVSMNNTNLRSSRTTLEQRRLVGAFGQAVFDYNRYLYLTVTGRNDWTSTIPKGRNSFFYPGVSIELHLLGRVSGDRSPHDGKAESCLCRCRQGREAVRLPPFSRIQDTSYGGYGYGFTGPNLDLKPEFARSYEVGNGTGLSG